MPFGATVARGSAPPKDFGSFTVVKPGALAAVACPPLTAPRVRPVSPVASRAKVIFRTRMSRPYVGRDVRTTEVRRPVSVAGREPEGLGRCAQFGPRAYVERQAAVAQRLVAKRGDGPTTLGAEAGDGHAVDR